MKNFTFILFDVFLFFIVLAANPLNAQVLHPKVNEADSLALVSIYNAMNGSNWNYKNNWLAGPLHTWSGVYVPDYQDRVASLTLYSNNLQGEFPLITSGLEELKSINFNRNSFSGSFPENICNLTSLEALMMDENQLSGEIPEAINNLVNLNRLSLKKNSFESIHSGAFDPNSLTNLEYLDLSENSLGVSGEGNENILKQLFNLTSLKELSIGNNYFKCPIPEEIGNLVNLTSLHLGACLLTGEIPGEVGNLTNLQYLNLGSNKLQGAVPASFGNLINLINYCSLAWNYLNDLPDLTPFPNLQTFDIYRNSFTFEDIIPNLDVATNVNYAPQDSVGNRMAMLVEPGDTKTIKWNFTEPGNKYQWKKDGTDIPGATSNEIVVEVSGLEDFGEYTLQVKNDFAPKLTLTTRPIIFPSPLDYIFCSITPEVDGMNSSPTKSAEELTETDFSLKVVEVVGEVELMRGNKDPVELRGGEVLVPSDRIYTGMESSVRLAFDDCSTVFVNELTDVKIESLQILGNAVNAQIWLKAGEVDAAVVEEAAVKSDFKVRTPTATCSVRGTNFSVMHDSVNNISQVIVTKGLVNVAPEYSPADSILLSPWQMVTVDENSMSPVSSFTLDKIEIVPDSTTVSAGRKRLLSAIGYDSEGNTTSVKVNWEATGGGIDDIGLYSAGSTGGYFNAVATEPVSNLNASSIIYIKGYPLGNENPGLKKSIEFEQYPNPSQSLATIKYKLLESKQVIIKIFDNLGVEVLQLFDEYKEAGIHSEQIDVSGLKNGIYYLKIQADGEVVMKKMIVRNF